MNNKKSKTTVIDDNPETLASEERRQLEKMVIDRTEALEIELADRKKAENKLILSLDKINRNRLAMLNLMEDLKAEMHERKKVAEDLELRNNELQFLNKISLELSQLSNKEDIEKFLPKQLLDFSGAVFVTFSEYDPLKKILITKHVESTQYIINQVIKLLGRNIVGLESPLSDEDYNFILNEKVGVRNTSTEISFGAISKQVDKTLRMFTRVERFYALTYIIAGELFGTSILGFRADMVAPRKDLLASFAHIAALSLQKRKAQKTLEKSEKDYRFMFENNPQPMWIYDIETLAFVEVNNTAILHYGYSKQEFLSMTLRDIRPRNEQDKLISDLDLAKRTFNPDGEWNHLKKNGGLIRVEIASHSVTFNDRPARHVLVNDITERKKMEEKLIESEAYYRTLVDISPDAVMISGMEGILTYCSMKTMEIFGVPPGTNVLGSSILNWVSPDYHRKVMERITEIVSGNVTPETREYKLIKQDGSEFWGELSSSPLNDRDDNPVGLLIVCRDVSERKKAETELIKEKEKAEESDRLKTAFIHNISHEIRTPMNAITGFSALLGEPGQSEETKNSFVRIIMESSDQLLKIVTDIIEISNIEAATIMINREDVNINSVMENIYKEYSSKAKEKNINFTYSTALNDREAVLQTDKTKLEQILFNLVNNAFKFSSEGKINLGYTRSSSHIEFYISDTGIGIPQSLHERVFDRFFQVESSIARKYEGTGLGLTITKAYVELLGGEIWLESEPSKGTVFYFTIPYIQPHDPLNSNENVAWNERLKHFTERTVLIAEDEEYNYLLLVEFLAPLKLNIIHVDNGLEAVNLCRSGRRIDLVIMDIKMPVMDGYTATREIRKYSTYLPVIAHTAYSFETDREKAANAGCSDFITKPINREKLIELVGKYLNN